MILYSQFVCTSHRILKEQSGRRMETPQRSIHKKSSVTTNSYLSSDVTVPDTRPKRNYTISRPERLPVNLAPSKYEPIVLNISYIWTSRRCSTIRKNQRTRVRAKRFSEIFNGVGPNTIACFRLRGLRLRLPWDVENNINELEGALPCCGV